ncbi:MAG: hypothetical protein JWO52_5349 [Gammaproteobacteria bacterium]|nr:hypothetical protein [Gammaproteobacteria bacterium]
MSRSFRGRSNPEERPRTTRQRIVTAAVRNVLIAARESEGLTQREVVDRLPTWLRSKQSTLAKVETGSGPWQNRVTYSKNRNAGVYRVA